MLKFRRFLYLSGSFLLFLVKFAVDIIRMNVEMDMGGLMFLRELAAAGAFFLIFLTLQASVPSHAVNPARRLGVFLFIAAVFMIGAGLMGFLPADGFDAKEFTLRPLDYASLFLSSLFGLLAGIFAMVTLRFLHDLVLMYQKKSTVRNFQIFIVLLLATAVSSLLIRPLESSTVTSVLYGLTLVMAVVNAFRMPWIVYQTKREKILTLVFSFFLFLLFTVGNILLSQNDLLSRGLLYYSRPVQEAVSLSIWFGNLFCGMVFATTLFHLPTAGAFDRKRSEVASIHTLSKLVTQVFDFEKLTESVTSMTLGKRSASCMAHADRRHEEHHPRRDRGSPGYRSPVFALGGISRPQADRCRRCGERSTVRRGSQRRPPPGFTGHRPAGLPCRPHRIPLCNEGVRVRIREG
ncbi:MAG: Serine phosphatase RsbU subunit sigma [Bacteroidetes bacterium]|nr:Serine phosphatase RsbU subunit sigma [Bacteroidota bacterium]